MERIGKNCDFLKNQRKELPHPTPTWLNGTNENNLSQGQTAWGCLGMLSIPNVGWVNGLSHLKGLSIPIILTLEKL